MIQKIATENFDEEKTAMSYHRKLYTFCHSGLDPGSNVFQYVLNCPVSQKKRRASKPENNLRESPCFVMLITDIYIYNV